MNEYGLIQGADKATFNWRGSMTRGDLILILYRSAGSPAVSDTSIPFTDVSETDYAYDAIVWAWKTGVAGGVSETEFCMKQPVTREQLASILYRLSGKPPHPQACAAIRMLPMSVPTPSMRCAGLSAAVISRETVQS